MSIDWCTGWQAAARIRCYKWRSAGIIIKGPHLNWGTFWSAASAIAALGVLIITVIYAWLTYRLAKAAESQIWQSSRASVIASVVTNQGGQLFLLHIEDLGSSPAESLRVHIDRPLHTQFSQIKPITDAPLFKNGVSSFPARHSVKFALGVSFNWLNKATDRTLHPTTFNITVEYETFGRKIVDTFPIDMESLYSLSTIDKDYLEEFGRTFPDKFERSIRDITRSIQEAAEPAPRVPRKRSWPEWFSQGVWAKHQWD